MEGAGSVLHAGCGWPGEPRRGVVLPRSEASGAKCEAPRGILARRGSDDGNEVTAHQRKHCLVSLGALHGKANLETGAAWFRFNRDEPVVLRDDAVD